MWPVIVLAGGFLGLVSLWAAARDARPCNLISDCFGSAITMLLGWMVGLVIVAAAMAILRFPWRDLLAIPFFVLINLGVWHRTFRLLGSAEVRFGTANETPIGLRLVAVALSFVASWVLVRRRALPLLIRLVPLIAVLVAALGLRTWAVETIHRRTTAEIAAVSVTYYKPDLGPTVRYQDAFASEDTLTLLYESGSGSTAAFPQVHLYPTHGRPLCQVMASSRLLGFEKKSCHGDDAIRTTSIPDFKYTAVAVLRGDTVVAASVANDSGLDPEAVTMALRESPVVTPDRLALRKPVLP